MSNYIDIYYYIIVQEEKEHELHQVRAENHELRKEKDLLLQRAAGTADEGQIF